MTDYRSDPGRPVVTRKKRSGFNPPAERPCPTCYAVMRQVDGWWNCPNHGPVMRATK